jgi:phenylacetate-CoA ligase
VGQTEQQLQAIAELRPDGYAGTPSFLRILVEKAEETGSDISSMKKGLVGGEALTLVFEVEYSRLDSNINI